MIIDEIKKLEEELRQAMFSNDIEKLDELIADSLVFVLPNGVVANKQMDLDSRKSGFTKMTKLSPSEQQIEIQDNFTVVTVKMELEGTYGDMVIDGRYRYIRTWAKNGDKYQIISGAAVYIPD